MKDETAQVTARLKPNIRKNSKGILSVIRPNRSFSMMCRKYIRQENREISRWYG